MNHALFFIIINVCKGYCFFSNSDFVCLSVLSRVVLSKELTGFGQYFGYDPDLYPGRQNVANLKHFFTLNFSILM